MEVLHMISVRLPESVERRLASLAEKTGRSKSYYVRLAIEEFLEDREDYLLAVSVLEKNNPRVPLEDLVRDLGLDD
jgi:RHH-type rel operon transcriptional repressor/antitoxin RelB